VPDEMKPRQEIRMIITAIGTTDHKKIKGLESFVRDYISKPFNPKELVQIV